MKRLLWMCACLCLSACAMENPGDLPEEEVALEEESGLEPARDVDLAAESDVGATSEVAAADGTAAVWTEAASAAACHGTVPCSQGTPGSWVTIFCGTPSCTNQGCSPGCDPADPDCEIRRVYRQPREQYRDWRNSAGTVVCREYRSYPAFLTCTCDL